MRIGMNPQREEFLEKPLPPDVPLVVVVTHLPNLEGYHKHRWDIVTKSLQLARQNVGVPHRLLVWDNGSMPELREWLQDEYKPDMLMLSDNIGVQNTMRRVMMMYSDSTIAWCNDDLAYYPDWLVPQLEILEAFPNVGTVSGCTTRWYMNKAVESTIRWAHESNIPLAFFGTPVEWDYQHAESIGENSVAAKSVVSSFSGFIVEYNGARGIIGGNHCQFVFKAERLVNLLYKTDKYMEPLFPFDIRVDRAGYLRLLTHQRHTRHLGNVLKESDRKELDMLLGKVLA